MSEIPAPQWNCAMEWLIWLQASPEDQELRAACEAWQRASPVNASAWQRAEQIWRLAGQLPPAPQRQRRPGKNPAAWIVRAICSRARKA
ncbi:DUF4880 domain-containing protein [Stutzerimonas stutzeri]|uniref:FecR N-terminal domain-containing protein n=2 Tax=Stutzerimonas stutzeri TaxID=316 RepID=M2TRM6_STUST|nr:hypothetical protein B381_12296 [Stutzerimonas stutzeri NF13]